MKTVAMAIVSAGLLCTCLAGCGDTGVPSSALQTPSERTTMVSQDGMELGQTDFVWQPDTGSDEGSDVANRRACGIVDGDGGTLFFQAPNGSNGPLYSLYAMNKATAETKELAVGCYGMVNVMEDAVFYIGEVDQGVFRYDRQTGRVTKEYDGIVQNLLATRDFLYFISGGGDLYQLELASGRTTVVAKAVAADYLEHVDGDLYFAQMHPDEMNCDVCKIVVGSPGKVASVCAGVPNPMKMVGTRVLYGDARGVQLRDISTGLDTNVYPSGNGATAPAANGNAVFYVTTDKDGYRELWAFDLDTEKASRLLPIHGGAIYFVEGEMYLVNPVNFDIERVILSGDDPHTELVLRGDSLAK